jgi:hypothetical protein
VTPLLIAALLIITICAVVAESLIIKISRHGKDETECLLSGKIPCKTFDYARGVDGNNGDVTMIILHLPSTPVLQWKSDQLGEKISTV